MESTSIPPARGGEPVTVPDGEPVNAAAGEPVKAALDGAAQLRALMESGFVAGIGESLDFTLIEVGDGRVTFAGTPGRHAYNPLETIHGGYAATLLDSACGCAVHSKLSASQGYTTLELKVSYHRAMTERTGPVRAEGWVVTLGRRAAFAEARIVDSSGRLYASASSTLLIFER